jgi:folate-dependent tRNA-U54 methylase TrmFO/GidA
MQAEKKIRVIGGGLAGPEAALVAAARGCQVELYEMRPVKQTPAHQTADFGELVCSNSLKSESEHTALVLPCCVVRMRLQFPPAMRLPSIVWSFRG